MLGRRNDRKYLKSIFATIFFRVPETAEKVYNESRGDYEKRN